MPDVSCQDIKLIFSTNMLLELPQTLSHYLWFSLHMETHTRCISSSQFELQICQKRKKIISKCKISCISIVENWTHVSHHFTAFLLIRARRKFSRGFPLCIINFFMIFLLSFVRFPVFFVSHSHLMKSSCKI